MIVQTRKRFNFIVRRERRYKRLVVRAREVLDFLGWDWGMSLHHLVEVSYRISFVTDASLVVI